STRTNVWTGGTVTLSDALTLTNLQLAGATVVGGPTLTVNQLDFTVGILGHSDTVVTGTMNWSPAPGTSARLDGGLTIAGNAVLNLNGADVYLWGGLTNAGTVNWTGVGDLHVNNDGGGRLGSINNLAGATFQSQNDQTIIGENGYPFFNNAGLLRKTA